VEWVVWMGEVSGKSTPPIFFHLGSYQYMRRKHYSSEILLKRIDPGSPDSSDYVWSPCCGALGQFAGGFLRIWEWSTKPPQGINLLLTCPSTIQQSIPVLKNRDGLKTETADVLSGVVEARNVRGRSPIRCALSSCLLHSLINAVYIKRSYPSPSPCTMCIFVFAYCLPWAVFTNFQYPALHYHFPRFPSRSKSVELAY